MTQRKAIRRSQFSQIKKCVTKSGHTIYIVKFTDLDGEEKTGFFKELADDYLEHAAKLSVFSSLIARKVLGPNAAEERLVYDEEGKRIIGTMSMMLPGFKAMLDTNGTIPPDITPEDLERICPSVQTLLKRNTMLLLVLMFFLCDDDRHPDNMDLEKAIDFDMCFMRLMRFLKGDRSITRAGDPEKVLLFLHKYFSDFPYIEGRTYWPTTNGLLKSTLIKYRVFASAEAFRSLAANPSITIDNKTIYAQEQFFAAVLRLLVVLEPDVLRQDLEDYFGDEKLDFMTLHDHYTDKQKELKKESASKLCIYNPDLFNTKTNQELFSDHCLKFFQGHYDEFYTAAVRYPGTNKNIKGVPVPSFRNFLSCRPSTIREIIQWAEEQNKIAEQQEEKIRLNSKNPNKSTPFHPPYNIELVKRRYHQILRDSQVGIIRTIQDNIGQSKQYLVNILRNTPPSQPKLVEEITKPAYSSQLVSQPIMYEKLEKVDCDPGNQVYKGLLQLHEFGVKLQQYIDAYFEPKQSKDLTLEHNAAFRKNVQNLTIEYEASIPQLLGASAEVIQFRSIIRQLNTLCYYDLNLPDHLKSDDRPLGTERAMELVPTNREHTAIQVVDDNIKTLFNWVKTMKSETFRIHVDTAIKKYSPASYNYFSNKKRGPEVQELMKTIHDPEKLLIRIFAKGEVFDTSLNSILIKGLMKTCCNEKRSAQQINLGLAHDALRRKEFNAGLYAQRAQTYAVKTLEPYIEELNHIMYDWVKMHKGTSRFKRVFAEALKEYIHKTRNPSHDTNLEHHFPPKRSDTQVLYTTILEKGAYNENSLKTLLFRQIMCNVANDFHGKADKKEQYALVAQLLIDKTLYELMLASLERYATGFSHQDENPSSDYVLAAAIGM